MRVLQSLSIFLVILGTCVTSASAIPSVQIPADGKVYGLKPDPGVKKFLVWYTSRGNETRPTYVELKAPSGTKARLYYGRGAGRAERSTLLAKKRSRTLPIVAAQQSLGGVFILPKDACAGSREPYRVMLEIDLSAAVASDESIGVGFREFAWRGRRSSTIKPVSDGRFAPQPLLLMTSIGAHSGRGDSITLRRWSQRGISKSTPLRVEDYVAYNGLTLTRSLVGTELTGGRGTFDITDGFSAYSVCFRLERVRQLAFGYPLS